MQSNTGKGICVCHLQYYCLSNHRPTRLRPFSSLAPLHRSHWPFYCLWRAAWYIRFVPNKDGSPFLRSSLLSGSRPYFSSCCRFFLLLLFCNLTVPPKDICAFSADLFFCLTGCSVTCGSRATLTRPCWVVTLYYWALISAIYRLSAGS